MHLQLLNDEQILDEAFRKRIIQEINGAENRERKRLAAATWEIWRDQCRKFVLERLKDQGFLPETLAIMNQRASNINLLKKIVSKKARSYSKGVSRAVPDNKKATADLEAIANAMDLTTAMKRADRYRKCTRNAMLYIYPEMIEDEENPGQQVLSLTTKVFFPHLYDVIPDARDREKVRCFILSPFTEEASYAAAPALHGGDGRQIASYASPTWQRDHLDQTIANQPRDAGSTLGGGKKEYVWWTAKYHLTCDENGKLISNKTPVATAPTPEGGSGPANPIGRLPCVNLCEEQDGQFWALGGDDMVESTILLNLKLTDMEAILHMQGWGQLVITGTDLQKKDFAVGPQKALMLDTPKGETHKTDAKILQHDPQTENHLRSTEVMVALCLTTNNLSVKSVSTNLEAGSVASAIAKMVDEADNIDDITEDQEYYGRKEKEALRIAEAWAAQIRGVSNCSPVIKDTKPLELSKATITFHNQEQVISESERLANLKLRKELGIDTLIDLIRKDNPSLTDEQARKKALELQNQKVGAEVDEENRKLADEQNGGSEEAPAPAEDNDQEEGASEGRPGQEPVAE